MLTKKENTVINIIVGLIMLGLLGWFILVVDVNGKASIYDVQKSKNLTTKYGEIIIGACDNYWEKTAAGDSVDSMNMEGLDDVKFLVLAESGGAINLHDWQKRIDKEYRAKSSSDHLIVICVNEIEDVIEQCWYTNSGVTNTIQDIVDLFFINPQTGSLMKSVTLTGEMPDDCPSSHSRDKHGDFDNKLFDNAVSEFISKLP